MRLVPPTMCRPDQQQLPSEVLDAVAKAVPAAPWLEPGPPLSTVQSGCDSSDCSYCQGLAELRRAAAAGGKPGCWLRRKRSRTDLTALAGADATAAASLEAPAVVPDAGPDAGPTKQARVASMWDHALAETSLVEAVLDLESEASTSGSCSEAESWEGAEYRPWSWDAAWAGRAAPPPARLRQVAAFQRPEPAGHRRQTADIVCAVEFEEHGWLMATAGVAKQIRVYSLSSYLENPEHPRWQQPIRVHRMPSKLSSLAWNPDQPGVVTVGDYDGEVTQIDLETGHMVAEADGHAGRRVWSVSHSRLRPHFCASASDDGTVKLWAGAGLASSVATVGPPSRASLTSVQLSPFDEHTLAVASADHSVYVYDLRRALTPVWMLAGHSRPASYVRFLGHGRLMSAAVDASLGLWDLPGQQQQAGQAPWEGSGADAAVAAATDASRQLGAGGRGVSGSAGCVVRPWRRLRGHRNCKNFVGLAVRPEEQLVACGSEDPAAFSYQVNWDAPLAQGSLGAGSTPPENPPNSPRSGTVGAPFCSAVCWQPAVASGPGSTPLLAAAMSDGELRVLGLQARQ